MGDVTEFSNEFLIKEICTLSVYAAVEFDLSNKEHILKYLRKLNKELLIRLEGN